MNSRLLVWLAFSGILAAQNPPSISPGGIVNASSLGGAPASPGGLISVFGSNFAVSQEAGVPDREGRMPRSLAGSSLRIGTIDAPLLFVNSNQINAQVPFELTPGVYPVTVTSSSGTSVAENLNITATSPAIFPGALVKNADGSLVSASNPVHPGDVIVIYCTGLGAVMPPIPTGQFASVSPISATISIPTVTIGGKPVQVVNSVLSPGYVGLYQIGIVIPSDVPTGAQPLLVKSGTVSAIPVQVVTAVPAAPCPDISGTWKGQENYTIKWTDSALGMTDTSTEDGNGSGTVTIIQDGCSIRYSPIGIANLIPGQLTPQQAAMLERQGTVSMNTLTVHGVVTLIDYVAAGVLGVTVAENAIQGTGQISGSVIQIQSTGRLAISGNVPGLGFVTETADVTSSVTLRRP